MLEDATTPVIVGAVRTPMGRFRGQLSGLRPDDLAALVLRTLRERFPAAMPHLEDVYFGAANQAGEDNRNVARMGLLLAGYPVEVPGVTVNRLCGSGMEAVLLAAKSIRAGEGEVYIAGGAESMSRAPFVMPKAEEAFPRKAEIFDTALGWRMVNPRMQALYPVETLGETAENVATQYEVSREAQDAWAERSHQRAALAEDEGAFDAELIPVEVPTGKKGEVTSLTRDENVRRDTSVAKLARLEPVFKKNGSVTAGNSSPLSDGAAAILLTSLRMAQSLGLTPLARIASWGHAGVHPSVMGIGPVPASQKALARASLRAGDLHRAELNEAFASQTVASIRQLELDPEIVNPTGGAIALGHPLGCSGARIVATLAHGLVRSGGRFGLASMCIGVGQGIACVLERLGTADGAPPR